MGNVPSAVPYGAQIDKIHTRLLCNTIGQYLTYNFTLSATAPLTGGAGQEIYYSDVVIGIDLDEVFRSSFESDFPNANYNIPVNVSLDLTNAYPTTIQIRETVNLSTQETHIRIPQGDGVLPPIGPVTLGDAGQVHRFALGKGDLVVYLGALDISLDCIKQDPEVIIGSVVIDNSTGPPLMPANGVPGAFPATQGEDKSLIANIPVQCSGDYGLTTNPFNLTIGGIGPTTLSAGQSFNVSELTTFLTLSDTTVAQYAAFYGGETTGYFVELGDGGNDPGLGVRLSNADPSNTDISRNFISTIQDEGVPLAGGRLVAENPDLSLSIGLPAFGSLTIGPYTAGEIRTVFSLDLEVIQGKLRIQGNGRNASGGYTYFNCTSLHPVEFFSANIA